MTKPTLNEIERFFNPQPSTTIQPKQPVTIGFKRLTEDATIPTKAHADDSGYDLVAVEDVIVEPGATVVVKTGIAVQLPKGYEATVRPRSGVTSKTKLRVSLGTIDNGYGGEIGVIVDNIAHIEYEFTEINDGEGFVVTESVRDDTYRLINGEVIANPRESWQYYATYPEGTHKIRKGDRIAQLVITRLPEVDAVEITELGESDRGGKGFGSSGVSATY